MTTLQSVLTIGDSVTIGAGSTTSDAIDMQGYTLTAIIMPATFTGTSLTFSVSDDGNTFYTMYNTSNTAVTAYVTQGRWYELLPSDFASTRYLKIISSATEGSARTIKLVRRIVQ